MHAEPLLIFFPPKQDRRIKVIQNVITGKSRTVATLFWGMQYRLLSCFKVFDDLPNEFAQTALEACVTAGTLNSDSQYQYRLALNKVQEYEKLRQRYQIEFNFQANLFFDIDRFAKRFYLANQIISEYSYHQSHYYPLQIGQMDQAAVKYWFHYHKSAQLVNIWVDLLASFLKSLPTNELAWQFASSLVGNLQVGATLEQQSQQLNLPVAIVKLRQRTLLNRLLNYIKSIDQPILNELFMDLKTSFVTKSALQTVYDWQSGLTLSQIANKRYLKLSTVKEHLEEAAMFISWQQVPFERLITKCHRQLFDKYLLGNITGWDFNALKEHDNDLDYFEFRLYQILRSKNNDESC